VSLSGHTARRGEVEEGPRAEAAHCCAYLRQKEMERAAAVLLLYPDV
jgi:hypothetical protein